MLDPCMAILILPALQICTIDLAPMVSGADAGNAEGREAVPGKALPPWLLRQGITSTSNAAGGLAGTPQAGVGASAGVGPSGEVGPSEEEDQKKIEVRC